MAEKETIKRIHEGHNDANFDLLAKSVLLSGKAVTEAVENLTSAETDLSDIRARLEELQKEIDALETGEGHESEELTDLKAQIETLAESVSTLVSRVASLQTDLSEIASIAEGANDTANKAVTEVENVQSIAQSAQDMAYENASDIKTVAETRPKIRFILRESDDMDNLDPETLYFISSTAMPSWSQIKHNDVDYQYLSFPFIEATSGDTYLSTSADVYTFCAASAALVHTLISNRMPYIGALYSKDDNSAGTVYILGARQSRTASMFVCIASYSTFPCVCRIRSYDSDTHIVTVRVRYLKDDPTTEYQTLNIDVSTMTVVNAPDE